MHRARLVVAASVIGFVACGGGGTKPANSPRGTGAIYGGGGVCNDAQGDKNVGWQIGLDKVERCFYRADKKHLEIKLEGQNNNHAAIDVVGITGPGSFSTGGKEDGSETAVILTGNRPGFADQMAGGTSAGGIPGYDCPAKKCTVEVTDAAVVSLKPGEKGRAAVKVTCAAVGFHAIGCGECTVEPQPIVVDVAECEHTEN